MKINYSICYLLLLSSLLTNAQLLSETANENLVTIPEKLALEQFKENIYIHTDKDIYEPGDNLWFKAYLLDANDLYLSKETKAIFVKFAKVEADSMLVLASERYEAENGFSHGDLFLNDTLHNGTYQLEIYTKGTLESASKNMRSVKQFQIVDNIIPKILMDVEFSKKKYTRRESIEAEVAVFSRDRAPLRNATVIAQLFSGDKRVARKKFIADDDGITFINFPAEKSAKATDLKLRVRFEGEKGEHSIEIPFEDVGEIQFGMYPEGGNLVENISNTLAFKALDPNGRPVPVEGDVYENGQKIQSFTAEHYGMGRFDFTPKANREYSVQLTNPKVDSIYTLPKIYPEGVTLQVKGRTERHIHFNVSRSKNVPAQQIYIRAQSRGYVYWMATASLEKEKIGFNLPLEEFPQGIVEVTIYNENFMPLAERLVYANMEQKLHITLKEISKKTFLQKDKVSVTFEVKDQYENPVIADFSLSVHDHLYDNKSNDYAMFPHYYLFSELKGHVYDASYYFDSNNTNRESHIDLLMMTQGWRSYVWNIENIETAERRYFNQNISGRTFIKTNTGVLKKANASDIQIISSKRIETIQTDEAGSFTVPNTYVNLVKGEKLMFSAENDVIVELYDHFENLEKFAKDKQFQFPQSDAIKTKAYSKSYDTIFTFDGMNYLDEVVLIDVKARQKERQIYRITNIRRYPPSGITEYPGKIGDFLCKYLYLNCPYHQRGPKPADKRLYRMPKTGELIFYLAPEEPERKIISKNYASIKGTYLTKQFYAPMYDSKDKDHKLIPDPRKTLFWAPNLVSNEKGELTVTFYTSDVQSTFLGRLEGTDGNGLLGTNIFKFDVR
jgi:hypothetical protein